MGNNQLINNENKYNNIHYLPITDDNFLIQIEENQRDEQYFIQLQINQKDEISYIQAQLDYKEDMFNIQKTIEQQLQAASIPKCIPKIVCDRQFIQAVNGKEYRIPFTTESMTISTLRVTTNNNLFSVLEAVKTNANSGYIRLVIKDNTKNSATAIVYIKDVKTNVYGCFNVRSVAK